MRDVSDIAKQATSPFNLNRAIEFISRGFAVEDAVAMTIGTIEAPSLLPAGSLYGENDSGGRMPNAVYMTTVAREAL